MKPTHIVAAMLVAALAAGAAAAQERPRYTDPEKADADFALQGEYTGTLKVEGEEPLRAGIQVIALGRGSFRMVAYRGGLPGDGADLEEKRFTAEAQVKDGVVEFDLEGGKVILRKGKIDLIDPEGTHVGTLERVERKSPTLGKKPPEGAVVLFDGTTAEHFQGGRMTDDGLLMEGATSKQRFGDHRLHLEFLLPYMPEDRGQGRGNSGVYVQGRYEVQMLDSFGLEGKDNECGGIYSVKAPDVNMCFPPLTWQTYDIEFTAARYDEAGKVAAPPRITVYHNGVKIHDDVELPADRSTTAAPLGPGPEPGPVYLQNHGNPVRYRNIWVVETK